MPRFHRSPLQQRIEILRTCAARPMKYSEVARATNLRGMPFYNQRDLLIARGFLEMVDRKAEDLSVTKYRLFTTRKGLVALELLSAPLIKELMKK